MAAPRGDVVRDDGDLSPQGAAGGHRAHGGRVAEAPDRGVCHVLEGQRVVVVGPVLAPARSGAVPRVDGLLAELAERHGAAYVRTTGLDLDYLDDRLHLTEAGHRALGRYVADQVAALG